MSSGTGGGGKTASHSHPIPSQGSQGGMALRRLGLYPAPLLRNKHSPAPRPRLHHQMACTHGSQRWHYYDTYLTQLCCTLQSRTSPSPLLAGVQLRQKLVYPYSSDQALHVVVGSRPRLTQTQPGLQNSTQNFRTEYLFVCTYFWPASFVSQCTHPSRKAVTEARIGPRSTTRAP